MSIDSSVKQQAISLRLQGKSYTQIQRELGLASKGTLSVWFKDLVLPQESIKLLEENIMLATEKGLLEFNTQRSRRILEENKEAACKGKDLVGLLSKRDLMLIGAALYWGEGTKSAGKNRTARLVFTNSDPKMIEVFMRFVREILLIPDEKIGAELHLYTSIDAQEAKKYWSDITGIPQQKFWTTNLVSRASSGKRPYNKLRYGTVAIRVPGRLHFHTVMGMIEALTFS